MTPRQARRERREAERKAKKLEFKQSRQAENLSLAIAADGCTTENSKPPRSALPGLKQHPAVLPSRSPNAPGKATGPRTPDGKLASSRNSFKHGLASGQVIVPGEDPAAFESLLDNLLDEHQPATATQQLLIEEMAQSHWLTQRALRLQNDCFTADGVNEKQLALFLRYQTTHQRAFYKALSNLQAIKKEEARRQRGFVSQQRNQPPPGPHFVSQPDRPASLPAGFVPQNPPSTPPDTAPQSLQQAA